MNNRYFYYSKIPDNFYSSDPVQSVFMNTENVIHAHAIISFFNQLLLDSLNKDGLIGLVVGEKVQPLSINAIARKYGVPEDFVTGALYALSTASLISQRNDNMYFIPNYSEYVGKDSTEAQRSRQRRAVDKAKAVVERPSNDHQTTIERQTIDGSNIEKRPLIQEKDSKPEIYPDSNKTSPPLFYPPSLEEVQAYCLERNNNINPQRFIDFYSSKNWMVGKNKMSDWKAAVRSWERSANSKSLTNPTMPTRAFNTMQNRDDIDYDAIERRSQLKLIQEQNKSTTEAADQMNDIPFH